MKRILFTLALCIPLTLIGCAKSSETTMTGEAGGGMMSDDMMEDAAERSGVPGDMLGGVSANATVVENAMAVAELSTLVEAVKAAGLVDVLNGPGPYTIFAPTNDAFDIADLELTSMDMSAEEQENLAMVLKAHVVDGKVMFGELNDGQVVETLTGNDFVISRGLTEQLEKRIGDADIIAYDIESSNGVIHVINLVLNDQGRIGQ